MEPRKTIPLDILQYIIDLVAWRDGDIRSRETTRSLQFLSLACKSISPLSRKHLFSSIGLHSKSKIEHYSDLLSKNPDIACYARELNLRCKLIKETRLLTVDFTKYRSRVIKLERST